AAPRTRLAVSARFAPALVEVAAARCVCGELVAATGERRPPEPKRVAAPAPCTPCALRRCAPNAAARANVRPHSGHVNCSLLAGSPIATPRLLSVAAVCNNTPSAIQPDEQNRRRNTRPHPPNSVLGTHRDRIGRNLLVEPEFDLGECCAGQIAGLPSVVV